MRSRSPIIKAFVAGVCALIGGYFAATSPSAPSSDSSLADNTIATVMHVSDGDTLVVEVNNKRTRVRLIGIDTPESSDNAKAERDAARAQVNINYLLNSGHKATQFVESQVHRGDAVRLVFDREEHDRYGRLLAYVYLSNGSMLNERIIASGYARPMRVEPNHRFSTQLEQAYQEARREHRGLWNR